MNPETAIGLAALIASIAVLTKKRRAKSRWWERPHLGVKKRTIYSQHKLLQEMRLSDVESFVSIIRLSPESFDKLLLIVGPSLMKFSNREPINPSSRLAVTLRYCVKSVQMIITTCVELGILLLERI